EVELVLPVQDPCCLPDVSDGPAEQLGDLRIGQAVVIGQEGEDAPHQRPVGAHATGPESRLAYVLATTIVTQWRHGSLRVTVTADRSRARPRCGLPHTGQRAR